MCVQERQEGKARKAYIIDVIMKPFYPDDYKPKQNKHIKIYVNWILNYKGEIIKFNGHEPHLVIEKRFCYSQAEGYNKFQKKLMESGNKRPPIEERYLKGMQNLFNIYENDAVIQSNQVIANRKQYWQLVDKNRPNVNR